MGNQKPSIPKGTRDFGPAEMARRNYIFNSIRTVFMLHGYLPIETPAMENLDTLLGKYGEEGDKLLFKILNSGDFLSGVDYSDRVSHSLSMKISEKGLRYDLTVPFARFVVQHQNDIKFPFKRYQIQPVWRADRPQKGRYREFFQCDVDVIGSNSLLNELDLIQIIKEVFDKLRIKIRIKVNNRKILAGIAEYIGYPDRITDITTAIDKYDKIGLEKVNLELKEKGIHESAVKVLENVLLIGEESNQLKLEQLSSKLKDSEIGMKGMHELALLLEYGNQVNMDSIIDFDLKLARGLNYYTGAIIEVKALDAVIGSICGGGRYDDLTGIFGLKNISGVGVSFGADRIYDVMEQQNLFPEETEISSEVLFVNFGGKEASFCLQLLTQMHAAGIAAELYPDPVKLDKQLAFANVRHIPFVVLAGEDEIRKGFITVKNMVTGNSDQIKQERLAGLIRGNRKGSEQ